MTALARLDTDMVSAAMFIRPQRPDDHEQFEWLLPQCTPLFVYEHEGEDLVRWAIPKQVAEQLGWGGGCQCCGKTEPATEAAEHALVVDIAYKYVDWYLERAHA